MADKKSKKKMVLDQIDYDKIKKAYPSTTENEIAALAYKLGMQTGKQLIIKGLSSVDCYVNAKGSITIGEAIVSDTNFAIKSGFIVSSDDTSITLTYDKDVELPKPSVKKPKPE